MKIEINTDKEIKDFREYCERTRLEGLPNDTKMYKFRSKAIDHAVQFYKGYLSEKILTIMRQENTNVLDEDSQ